MSTRRWTKTGAAVTLGLLIWAGCGDAVLEEVDNSSNETEEASQKAKVIPEFTITGLDNVPEELMLEQLGLSVGEIRLEPLRGNDGFVYATSEPISLTFDLSQGEKALEGRTVEFPDTGRFLVSIRLEPPDEPRHEVDESLLDGSLGIQGQVRSDYRVSRTDGREDDEGDENDGNPLPLPAERPSDGDDMWTPFALTSDRVVAYTFSDIELTRGEQVLSFEFDVEDWATNAASPIADAVDQTKDEEVVDIGREVDSDTVEAEALLGTGSVSTATH